MARRGPATPGTDSQERLRESVALLEMLALGNRQIEAGQVQPAGQVVAQLRDRRAGRPNALRGPVDR